MPQMAPISWLSLFIIFSINLILFSMMNYYSMIPKSPKSQISQKSFESLNWKW
uniref:ATP synthase F0 subunit 8 n=1 Tax=Rhagoletis batava TaxID=235426 RepID=UPI0023AB2098|nr:ATP synthase F0 subunit 8 [Rhagoletis batava]WCB98141.1 ATP synthase F0 subunit 8 [Rhagoletis batava]WCB98154.1 ATP synthase F0 subunit 8 [Rhagoletis batava]WCB98167.1 ATP synthase F0 subunit 8 [Rhagoletis batava]